MEVASLLFVMFLLSLGVLLILLFRRGLREQALYQERRTNEARMRRYAAMRAARRNTQPAPSSVTEAAAPAAQHLDEKLKPNP